MAEGIFITGIIFIMIWMIVVAEILSNKERYRLKREYWRAMVDILQNNNAVLGAQEEQLAERRKNVEEYDQKYKFRVKLEYVFMPWRPLMRWWRGENSELSDTSEDKDAEYFKGNEGIETTSQAP